MYIKAKSYFWNWKNIWILCSFLLKLTVSDEIWDLQYNITGSVRNYCRYFLAYKKRENHFIKIWTLHTFHGIYRNEYIGICKFKVNVVWSLRGHFAEGKGYKKKLIKVLKKRWKWNVNLWWIQQVVLMNLAHNYINFLWVCKAFEYTFNSESNSTPEPLQIFFCASREVK